MDQSFMRCKFMVHAVTEIAGDQPGVSVRMGAVYEPYEARAHTENAIFGKHTPYGEFSASIFNPAVAERLRSLFGKSVYLDFTEAPPSEAVG